MQFSNCFTAREMRTLFLGRGEEAPFFTNGKSHFTSDDIVGSYISSCKQHGNAENTYEGKVERLTSLYH